MAEFVWKDACTFEGFPQTDTELPPQPQGQFSCSVVMDVAFVVDRRLLTTITDVNNARAFLAAVVLKLDVQVSTISVYRKKDTFKNLKVLMLELFINFA